jgi:GTP-binding protein
LPANDARTPRGRATGQSPDAPVYRDLPAVAIVGRPNVGKSTLFNRIVRGRAAIVDDAPGVTRDRKRMETQWAGKRFFVIDTGGLVPGSSDRIEALVRRQVELAVEEAAVVVMVVDGTSGPTALDQDIAGMIRKKAKIHILVVNKADTKLAAAQAQEFYRLGLGDFIMVSAEHGINTSELLDAVAKEMPLVEETVEVKTAVAIVGRPNVGKSSLVNSLAGTETVIVDDVPGTTRDSTDTVVRTKHGLVRLVDTAGLRRKSRTSSDLEKYANMRSLAAVDRSDVVVLMLDASSEIAKQDLLIASYVERAGKGLVVTWNKWDLRQRQDKRFYLDQVAARFRKTPYLPVAFTSCLTGEGLGGLVDLCLEVAGGLETRIPTGTLNRAVGTASEKNPPSGRGKGFPKIYYTAQTGTRPPAFTLFVNNPELFTESYRRHVEKVIRTVHPFQGVPIRIRVRRSK